jgi:hypothetical protein
VGPASGPTSFKARSTSPHSKEEHKRGDRNPKGNVVTCEAPKNNMSLLPTLKRSTALFCLATLASAAHAQYLFWQPPINDGSYRCIYGEITVLATAPTTYYCGCNWWPSATAGGYTGIQDLDGNKHPMIFSIWDTSKTLQAKAIDRDDPRAQLTRFGGEGEGAKTMLDNNWGIGKTYHYFVIKRQDANGNNTLASAYFFDDQQDKWVYEATISSPNNGENSVKGFGGMLNSFVENYGGQLPNAARLALYRLWVGNSPADLTCVTQASGKGSWGVLNDSFFIGSGDPATLANLVKTDQIGDTPGTFGPANDTMTIGNHPMRTDIIHTLQRLLHTGQN